MISKWSLIRTGGDHPGALYNCHVGLRTLKSTIVTADVPHGHLAACAFTAAMFTPLVSGGDGGLTKNATFTDA